MMLTPFSDACPTLLFAPHLGKFPFQGILPGGGLPEGSFFSPDTERRVGEALGRPPLCGIGMESDTLTQLSFLIATRDSHKMR
jgi:hypothetical protein